MIINTISKEKRAIIYALCATTLLIIPCNSSGFEWLSAILRPILFLFFAIKSNNLFGNIKLEKLLKEADEKTEILHEGKIYKIDSARIIKKIEYTYRPALILAKCVFFDAIKKSKLRTILYQSHKGNYFICTLYMTILNENLETIIDPLSTDQAKDWLYHTDIELYKQNFGEFDEA